MQGFDACEICSKNNWSVAYTGAVRDGKFGNLTAPTVVGLCGGCKAERLIESSCVDESQYESEDYRRLLQEDPTSEGFFKNHDPLQLERLNIYPPYHLRNKVVADVGCAAGAFLDHVHGLTTESIAIEPAQQYHESLRHRGYQVYRYASDAMSDWVGKVDVAFSFSVIEHVLDPKQLLIDIRQMLSAGSRVIVSTPNRHEAMFKEIARIVKPGGRVYVFESILRELHQIPDDYLRYTPFGMRNMLESVGLVPEDVKQEGGPFSAVAYCWVQALQYFPEAERATMQKWFDEEEFPRLMRWDEQHTENKVRDHTSFPVGYSIISHKPA